MDKYKRRITGRTVGRFYPSWTRCEQEKTSAIRTKLARSRFFHIASGKSDFSVGNSRYRIVLKTLSRRSNVNRKYHMPAELLHFMCKNLDARDIKKNQWARWNAARLVFSFMLRGCELDEVHLRDTSFNSDANGVYSTLLIKSSKTDIKSRGLFRPRMQQTQNCVLCGRLRNWRKACGNRGNLTMGRYSRREYCTMYGLR